MSEKDELLSVNSFSDEEQRFALDAYNAFQQGQFDSCISTLKKIQKSHPGDCKLMHNRAVAEFYKSNQTKTGDLKKSLSKVHKVSQQSHQDEDDLGDDSTSNEYSTFHYNQALLYYFFHQFSEAQSVLERFADNSEATHNLKERSLLLSEVYICNFEPEKANRLIGKIEESFLKPTSPQQSKSGLGSENKEKGKGQKSHNKDVKNSLPLLKARCCLQMKSMKACKRELKAFSNPESNPDMSPQAVQTISVFLKSNFEFLRGNFHKAYKLLGSSHPSHSVNTSWMQNGESLLTMFYNNLGVIHFYMGKYNLGSFYLSKALEENDKAISSSPTPVTPTSSRKGDKHQQHSASSNTKTLQMLNMNKKLELLYNAGIQLLFSGKPTVAFDYLIIAVQVYYSNPSLWLRLAECCIQACCSPDKSENFTPGSPSRKSKFSSGTGLYTIVGSGIHRKMIAHPVSHNWTGTGNSVMPSPTLEFASVCLQNALTILAEAGISGINIIESKKNSKNEPQPPSKKADESVPCCPTAPISGQELSNLHASVLANAAFVALSLGNNLMAYEYSKVLLQLPNLSTRHRYLGRMYSAEALVSLDRISDAIHHLSSDTMTDLSDGSESNSGKSSEDPSTQTVRKQRGPPTTQCCFKSVQYAQACMLLNHAVARSLRSEFDKAHKLLAVFATMMLPQDVPPNAILLSAYVNLHTNGPQAGLKILQNNSLPHHTTAAVLTSLQTAFRPQQPIPAPAKQFPPSVVANSPSATASSSGSSAGGSSAGSKSSTPQPQHGNPPSGSVTPERVVKSTKSEGGGSKTKRGRR